MILLLTLHLFTQLLLFMLPSPSITRLLLQFIIHLHSTVLLTYTLFQFTTRSYTTTLLPQCITKLSIMLLFITSLTLLSISSTTSIVTISRIWMSFITLSFQVMTSLLEPLTNGIMTPTMIRSISMMALFTMVDFMVATMTQWSLDLTLTHMMTRNTFP